MYTSIWNKRFFLLCSPLVAFFLTKPHQPLCPWEFWWLFQGFSKLLCSPVLWGTVNSIRHLLLLSQAFSGTGSFCIAGAVSKADWQTQNTALHSALTMGRNVSGQVSYPSLVVLTCITPQWAYFSVYSAVFVPWVLLSTGFLFKSFFSWIFCLVLNQSERSLFKGKPQVWVLPKSYLHAHTKGFLLLKWSLRTEEKHKVGCKGVEVAEGITLCPLHFLCQHLCHAERTWLKHLLASGTPIKGHKQP